MVSADARQLLAGLLLDGVLDVADDLLGLVLATVDEQPARALGDVAADEQDADGEHGAEPEGEPPAQLRVRRWSGRAAGWSAARPPAAPTQNEPLMAMSIRPRYLAGISSSIAELMAAYSPPMPAPVMDRQTKYHVGFIENAVSTVPTSRRPSVIRNSFFRPNRSVSWPKNSAPMQAPAT